MISHTRTVLRNVFSRLLPAALLLIAFASTSQAIPRFSLLTGTRCSACHFNPQGSGVRTELGWEMMNQTGTWKWKRPDSTESELAEPGTNKMFGGTVIPGLDARGQLVRSSKTGERLFVPMQLSAELGVMPMKHILFSTNINLASIEERIRGGSLYPGETDFDAMLQYEPDITLPSIRVGMIQPSIGIRQDDHTEFVRQEAGLQGISLIPPYYNELGAELTYEGIRWLTINAGVFNSYNLSQVDPTIGNITSNFDFSRPSVSGRVMFWPQSLESGINGEVGVSALLNGSFRMYNGFVGFGLADKSTLFLEGMYCKNADQRIIRNFSIIGTYQLFEWLSTDLRFDWGQTELYPGKALGYAQGLVLGFEWFVLPYIEIRPEYRLFQRNPVNQFGTYTGQYTGQIHVFY